VFNYQAAALEQRRQQDSRVDARDVENVLRIHNLIASSVDDDLFGMVLWVLKGEGKHGVRAILQTLRTWAAPTEDQQPEGLWEEEVWVEEAEEKEEVEEVSAEEGKEVWVEEGEEVWVEKGEEAWVEEGEDFCN
jgi:hypothetical protein